MPNLTPSWQTCRVIGRWVTSDHQGLRPGTYTVTYPRTRNTKQKAIAPAGVFAQGNLNTDPGTPLPAADTDPIVNPSLDLLLPATDDADLRESFKATITVTFPAAASETYVLDLPSGGTLYLDDFQPTLASTASAASSLKLGLAGGVALLNSAGQVVDASGTPVTGGTGGGTGTVTAVNGRTPVSGVVTLTASDVGAASANDAATAQAAAASAQAAATAASSSAAARVSYTTAQTLTDTQQAQARANIGAAHLAIDPATTAGLPDGTLIAYTT